MHESDSFISEVSEAVRRDRLTADAAPLRLADRGAVVLIVGGAAVNEWLKVHNAAAAAAEGDALRAALAETDAATRDGDARRHSPAGRAGGGAGAAGRGRQPRPRPATPTGAAALLERDRRRRHGRASSTARWRRSSG